MCNLIYIHTYIHRKEWVGPVANSGNVESNKEAGGGAQGTLGCLPLV